MIKPKNDTRAGLFTDASSHIFPRCISSSTTVSSVQASRPSLLACSYVSQEQAVTPKMPPKKKQGKFKDGSSVTVGQPTEFMSSGGNATFTCGGAIPLGEMLQHWSPLLHTIDNLMRRLFNIHHAYNAANSQSVPIWLF
ncbi:hypothetical protein PWT90_07467 [Aphanocladium album]|nr:hypothetical protein PWT90_07467 [Aphanocladium album]